MSDSSVNWAQIAEISQVALTLITAIGLIISLRLGARTLKHMQEERQQDVRPYLVFDLGGQLVRAKFSDHSGIPGLNPAAIRQFVENKPPGKNRLDLSTLWGGLRNHGSGTALNVSVTFFPIRVHIGNENFKIDDKKRSEFPYLIEANHVPAHPSHIRPGESGAFMRLPTPIVVDWLGRITRLDCLVQIQYQDVFRNEFQKWQGLRIFIEREKPQVTLTFLEEVNASADNLPDNLD